MKMSKSEEIINFLYSDIGIAIQGKNKILSLFENEVQFTTVFDMMSLILNNGIMFEGEKCAIGELIEGKCYKMLNYVVDKGIYLSYHPLNLALAIIRLVRELNHLENKDDIFEKFYNISFSLYEESYNKLKSQVRSKG